MDISYFKEIDYAVKHRIMAVIFDILFRPAWQRAELERRTPYFMHYSEAQARLYIDVVYYNDKPIDTLSPGGKGLLMDYLGTDSFSDEFLVQEYQKLIVDIPIEIRAKLADEFYQVSTFSIQPQLVGTEKEYVLVEQLDMLRVPKKLVELSRMEFNYLHTELLEWNSKQPTKIHWPAYFSDPVGNDDIHFSLRMCQKSN